MGPARSMPKPMPTTRLPDSSPAVIHAGATHTGHPRSGLAGDGGPCPSPGPAGRSRPIDQYARASHASCLYQRTRRRRPAKLYAKNGAPGPELAMGTTLQTQRIRRTFIHTFPARARPANAPHRHDHAIAQARLNNATERSRHSRPLITPGHVMADNCGHGHRHARHSNAVFPYPSPHPSCRYAAGTDGQDHYHQPCLLSQHHGSPALQCLYVTRSPGEP